MERISCVNSYEVVICLAASILVYSNALHGPFLHDDIKAIIQNKDVQGEDEFHRLWFNDFWGTNITLPTSHKSYRPLTIISFRATYSLWGLRSLVFRVENILLNAFVTFLLLIFCKRSVFLTPSTRRCGPLITGLLFSLHPVHVEAVVGVVGRAELLSAAFLFLSLIVFTTSPTQHRDDRRLKSSEKETRNDPDALNDTRNSSDQCNLRKRRRRRNDSSVGSSERRDSSTNTCDEEKEERRICESRHHHLFTVICQHIIAALLCCCSMLCKETGITSFALLIGLVLVDLLEKEYFSNKEQVSLSKYFGSIFFFCFTGSIIFYLRLMVMDFRLPIFHGMDNPAAASNRLSTKLMTFSALPWMNTWLLMAPVFLCYDWSYQTIPLIKHLSDWRNFISLGFFILLVAFLFIQLCLIHEKSSDVRAMFLGTLLLVIPYLPSSNIFFPVGFVIAERTLFLPSAGFSVLISLFYCKVKEHSKKRVWCDAVLILYLSFYATRTLIRNSDWSSKYNFHRSGVVWNPQNAKCQYNFANTLSALHRNEEAIEHYEESIKLYPKSGAMTNLAYLLQTTYPKDQGIKVRIEKWYKSAIQLSPAVGESYFGLANFYIKNGHYSEAGKILVHGFKLIATLQRKVVVEILRKLSKKQQLDISSRCYHVLLCRECNKNPNAVSPDISSCDEESLDYLVGYRELMVELGESAAVSSIESRMKQLRHESSSEILVQTAEEVLRRDAEMATQLMLKVLGRDSFYETTAWRMAQKLFRLGALSQSEQLYSQLTRVSPENLDLLTQHAVVLFETGKEEKAVEMLGEKVKVDITCEMLRLRKHLSIMYMKRNLFLEAVRTFESCMEILTDEKDKIYVLVNLAKIKRKHYLILRDSKEHGSARLKIREIVQWLRDALQGLSRIPENILSMKEDLESEERLFL